MESNREYARGMENITIPPVEVLKNSNQINYDLVSPDPESIRFVAKFAGGTERFMFSTDFPWVDPTILFGHVREAFPEQADQERVFSGTAKSLIVI